MKDTQRLSLDSRVSNLHVLRPLGVSLVTSEGLSRVEVALENGDVDLGELSRLAGLHLGLADVKDGCLSQIYNLEAPTSPLPHGTVFPTWARRNVESLDASVVLSTTAWTLQKYEQPPTCSQYTNKQKLNNINFCPTWGSSPCSPSTSVYRRTRPTVPVNARNSVLTSPSSKHLPCSSNFLAQRDIAVPLAFLCCCGNILFLSAFEIFGQLQKLASIKINGIGICAGASGHKWEHH